MSMPVPEPAKFSLAAHAEERFFAPLRNTPFNSRAGFITAVAVVLLIHAAILGALLYRDSQLPPPPPEETPVEVVMEQPKPPEPPPQKQQQQQKQQEEDEKPAYSAPRVSKEPVNDPGQAEKTEGPKAATPPRDGLPTLAKQALAPPPPEKPDETEQKAALEDDKSEAEALDKAAHEPSKNPEKAQSKPKPKPADPSTGESDPALSGRTDNSTPSFASADALEDYPGGTESNRYIARIFGMIIGKKHYVGSVSERRGETGTVAVSFYVDYDGHVRHQEVVRSSGLAGLDALAMGAIRFAGPFPPPPGAGGQAYIATITFP
jgi:protein TonB